MEVHDDLKVENHGEAGERDGAGTSTSTASASAATEVEATGGAVQPAALVAALPKQGPQRERQHPRRAIHFLLERVATQPDTYSADLVECMRQPWWSEIVRGDFVHRDYYQLLNHKNLAKELTEAWTSYLKVARLLERMDLSSAAARRRQLLLHPQEHQQQGESGQNGSRSRNGQDDHRHDEAPNAAESDGKKEEHGDDDAEEEPELYLFDMCSGKGFNVFLISKMLPGRFRKIYAIDKDQKMNLDHFAALSAEANGTRVKFKYADVHHRRFSEWLARKLGAPGGNEGNRKARRHRKWIVEKQRKRPGTIDDGASPAESSEGSSSSVNSAGLGNENTQTQQTEEAERERKQELKRRKRVGIFLGVHLCGELSQTFIELYNKNPGLAGMILSPCCLPKHDRGPVERAKKVGVDSYSYWALQLYLMVGPGPMLTYKDLAPVEDVLSTKNAFITAIKRPFMKSCTESESEAVV